MRAGKQLYDLVNIEPEPQKLTTHDDSETAQMVDDILDISLLSLDTDTEDCSINNDLESINMPEQRKILGHPKDYLSTWQKRDNKKI